MIEFAVKIPSTAPLTDDEVNRVVWAIYNALNDEMKKDVGDLKQLNLNHIIVDRK